MAKKYLKIDYKTSQFYEFSKTAQEGFKQVGEYYRKYYEDGVTGELANVGVLKSDKGSDITFVLKVDGDYIINTIRLYDQRGNVDNGYAESLISFLGNLKKGETYRIYPYKLDADTQREFDQENGREVRNKYYDRYGISLKDGDGNKVQRFLSHAQDADESIRIPRLDWEEDVLDSTKKKPTATSQEARNKFLLLRLKDATEGHLAYQKTTKPTESEAAKAPSQPANKPKAEQTQTQTQEEKKPAAKPVAEPVASLEDDYDDLPF